MRPSRSSGENTAAAKPKFGRRSFLTGFAGAALACMLAFGVQGAIIDPATAEATGTPSATQTVINTNDDATLAEAVAAKCLPSVVYVETYADAGGQLQGLGTGSGVVMTEDGYLITNNHVVDGGSAYKVTIAGNTYDAELVGTDPSSDVAVLKAKDASGLTPMEIGDSDNLTVGEWVMTLGAPFGLEQSVATGIVSATSRSQIMDASESMQSGGSGETTIYPNMIQTDAAINPGNSGGPTFNAAGQVIGINSSIASTATSSNSAGSIGIGFAIPSNLVKRVANEIIKDGKVKHVALGVTITTGTVEADGVTRAGAKVTAGTSGSAVVSGSPADKAGLKVGDVIVAYDGNAVSSTYSLLGYVRASALNDKVTLTIVRGGKTMDVEVTLDKEESAVNGSGSSNSNNNQNNQNNQNGNGQNGNGNGNGNNGNSNNGNGNDSNGYGNNDYGNGGFSDPFGLW